LFYNFEIIEMIAYIYTCERCGNEKEIHLDEGQTLQDKMCGCQTHESLSSEFMMYNPGGMPTPYEHEGHSHSCGCGRDCGCH
jgi:hypothetical protein